MSGTHTFTMGARGRVVLPIELRSNRDWPEGTTLIAVETAGGVVVATREELESIVRRQIAGVDLVGELLAERRAAAAGEDAR
jgi:bifunctional DNA-binding transcriptional regulator/antitoxin component of YhaV-PrlF toxin-antitoxin module